MSEFSPQEPVAKVAPVTLSGRTVRLEPIAEHHRGGLRALHADEGPRIFANSPFAGSFDDYFDEALAACEPDVHVPFVVRRMDDEAFVGMSRLFDIHPHDRGLEIGYTWYHPAFWGGATNPECKLLLMTYVFETCGYGRVQLKTDVRNAHSQAAMTKMGAKREGELRHQKILPDGRWRDSVFFSVLGEEWPAVKAGLERRLSAIPV
ncbi:RimJ/RimL family protein N-acetyltransferase [Breoghania corrubedonensis]|uniref:RimJ/RimL family protein N-acetyltransferase n=1 Tax=Breoghania corrubedonensis TaxID=665038 RepID=A0A2T5VHW5_9HYPH|nr:GNAT family protein [Breoghania corrubedonensis]PTW63340.1 RimJ/RimL family protein N-acetyltransferase [Breoghania corrubedonensis]